MSARTANVLRVAIAAAAWVFLVSGEPAPMGYDLSSLVVGARLLDTGRSASLYDHDPLVYNVAGPVARQAAREVGFRREPPPFIQPPLLAVAARPLARIPFGRVLRGWTLVSAAAFVAGAFLSALWALHRPPRPAEWLGIAAVLAFSEPARYAIWLGQTTPFLFLFAAAGLALARRAPAGGALAAVPAFWKITPGALAGAWLSPLRPRTLAAFALSLAALAGASVAAVGWEPNVAFVRQVRELGSLAPAAFNNQSVGAVLERFQRPPRERWAWARTTPSAATRAGVAVVALVLLAAVVRRARGVALEERERVLGAGALLAMLLLPGISWSHYHVFLIPAALAAAALARADGWPRARVGLFLALAALLVTWPVFPRQVTPSASGVVDGAALSALVVLALLATPRGGQPGGRLSQSTNRPVSAAGA